MARREFTILATRCADAPLEAPKCEKPGYPSPKAWKIATITPTSRSGVDGSWINFSKGRSHGKHQNLVARGGRGHLGSGGSSAPGYQRRYVDAAAAGGNGRGGGCARRRAAGKPSHRATGFLRVGRRQRRGRGQYQRR